MESRSSEQYLSRCLLSNVYYLDLYLSFSILILEANVSIASSILQALFDTVNANRNSLLDRPTREKALESLRIYLSSNRQLNDIELLKLWKGLFFCTFNSILHVVKISCRGIYTALITLFVYDFSSSPLHLQLKDLIKMNRGLLHPML